jgi:DUF4097 and DUF4098 domain-containing protein YvlB
MSTVLDPVAPIPVAPSPGVRTTWRVLGSLAAAALLLWGVSQTVSLLAHEEHDEVSTFAADGVEVIDIHVEDGSIEVTAADVDEITVEAHVSDGLRPTAHDERLEQNRLVLESSCPLFLSTFCSVDYDVTVPEDVDVRSSTSNGRLEVVGTTGSVEASSDNGSIVLVDVEGDVELHSSNGSLQADGLRAHTVTADTDNGGIHLAFAAAPSFVSAESDNGSVEVRLPEVAGGYRVDMSSDNGSTELGVATDPASDRHIEAFTDNGSVRVLGTEGGAG